MHDIKLISDQGTTLYSLAGFLKTFPDVESLENHIAQRCLIDPCITIYGEEIEINEIHSFLNEY